jgi:hypothetical protein
MRRFLRSRVHVFIIVFSSFVLGAFSVSLLLAQDRAAWEKVKQANDLAIIVVRRAAEARETCDCELQKEALESANKAAVLLSEAVAAAEKTGNLALAQDIYNIATNVFNQAMYFLTEVCTYCSRTSLDLEAVSCFEERCAWAAETENRNNETIQTALAVGVIPTEPEAERSKAFPLEDEEYIRDHEQPPASPV